MRTIFGILMWVYWGICISVFFCIVFVLYVATMPFDKYKQIPNAALKGLGWVMLKINPGWTFEIKGADPGKVAEPTIVVANHQSFLDMPLSYLLPWSMKWVAKKDLFKIPVLGWIIYMTGHIGIDRQSVKSAQKLNDLVKPIKHGAPGMIFPEGTRTQTGDLRPFKNGAFKLAKRYNFNILPIVLEGGHQAMPRGSWKAAWKQHFTISVLDPLDSEQFNTEDELRDATFQLINEELQSLQSAS